MQSVGFFSAAGYLGRGWTLVRKPGLRRFVLIPLCINVAVFTLLGWLLFGAVSDWMTNWALIDRFGDIWLINILVQILQFVAGALLLITLVYVFTLVANIIGAPFNALLAERVEMHLTGESPSTDPSVAFLVKSIPKTLASETAKLVYLALWSIPVIAVGFIPVVGPFIVFAFGAWMFALEYLDYPMGNHNLFFKEVKRDLRQRRIMSLGFGSAVALFTIIPLVNLVIMPVAVAGATALYVDHLGNNANASS